MQLVSRICLGKKKKHKQTKRSNKTDYTFDMDD